MKKVIIRFSYPIILFLLTGCGGVPPTYYYRIDYNVGNKKNNENSHFPLTLGIAQFSADVLYEGDRIVYRESPYQAQFYYYRRWVAPPKKIVTEKVLQQYKASDLFQKVVGIPSPSKIDYLLKGRIQAFEEWDEGSSWYGIVTIAFKLHDAGTNEIIWENVFSEKTIAQKKEPIEVVKAISQSLTKVIEKSIAEIKENLKISNI